MSSTMTAERPAVDTSGFRMLHTMIRVLDLDKSIDFYTRLLGMNLLRRTDYEGGRFTLAFVGYGDEKANTVIELTHNWDQTEPYTIGSGFGHLAIGVPDIYGTCEKLAAEGVKRIAIVNPGFSADCIETLEEIDGEVREVFMHAGGERFSHIPCLNDSEDGMRMIEGIVRRELEGWL